MVAVGSARALYCGREAADRRGAHDPDRRAVEVALTRSICWLLGLEGAAGALDVNFPLWLVRGQRLVRVVCARCGLRKRLGRDVLREVFERACGPFAGDTGASDRSGLVAEKAGRNQRDDRRLHGRTTHRQSRDDRRPPHRQDIAELDKVSEAPTYPNWLQDSARWVRRPDAGCRIVVASVGGQCLCPVSSVGKRP